MSSQSQQILKSIPSNVTLVVASPWEWEEEFGLMQAEIVVCGHGQAIC